MNIRIRYFASLRETTGLNEEALTLPDGTTVTTLRGMLFARYPRLQTVMERALCAVNHQYVSVETILREGDEVVFIPPVGGGAGTTRQNEPGWDDLIARSANPVYRPFRTVCQY